MATHRVTVDSHVETLFVIDVVIPTVESGSDMAGRAKVNLRLPSGHVRSVTFPAYLLTEQSTREESIAYARRAVSNAKVKAHPIA